MEPISLAELNTEIKKALSGNLDPSYWVIAEIGEIRLNQRGHCYLELIEKQGEELIAKSRATIWAYTYRNINGWFESITGTSLAQGMSILANVQVSYHEVYGLSLNIKDIDPKFTLGERERKKQETIAKLEQDGVFDMNRMQVLPLVPQRVAVISSSSAAGFGDFMNQIQQSGYRFEIKLFNASLQGDTASKTIVSAMHQAAMDDFDVLVIIRGGGAQVDLDAFNDYELCNHIAQFPLPVLTGIGHERDETIADMVAHTKLKTPTAAAEFLISAFRDFEEQLAQKMEWLQNWAATLVYHNGNELDRLQQNLSHLKKQQLENARFQLFRTEDRLKNKSLTLIEKNFSLLASKKDRLQLDLDQYFRREADNLDRIEQVLTLSSPTNILRRGYTISRVNGKLLTKSSNVLAGDELETIGDQIRISSTIKQKTDVSHE